MTTSAGRANNGPMTTVVNVSGRRPQFSVGDRVRKARESAGMSQQDLAEAAGMARSGIVKIEGPGGRPRRTSLIAIALATGVDLDWLENGDTPAGNGPGGGSECAIRDSNPEPADLGYRQRLHAA